SLHVAQVDIVAQSGTHDPTRAGGDDGDLRLRIVPGRNRVEADIGTIADRRHGLALGEDFGIGADADLQILRPDPARDEPRLDGGGLVRARFQLRKIVADQPGNVGADRIGTFRRAPRLLFYHALQKRDDEGDAGSLYRLKVDRGKQARPGRVAAPRHAVFENIGNRTYFAARRGRDIGGRIVLLADVATGGRGLGR